MARIRTIKPEFPQSESMGNVCREARLLFILLWPFCDDHGKARGSSRLLASLLYPYDKDVPELIDGWFDELVREGCVIRYEVEGAHYVKVAKWLEHQKIDRPSASKFPDPSEGSILLAKPREASSSDQGPGPRTEGPGSEEAEGNAREEPRAPAAAAASDQLDPPPFLDRSVEGEAFRLWQEAAKAEGWPDGQFLTSTRRLRLRAILGICGGLPGFITAIEVAKTAAFLRTAEGQLQRWFDFDWLLDEQKFTRLMEGRYAERHEAHREPHGGAPTVADGIAAAFSRRYPATG